MIEAANGSRRTSGADAERRHCASDAEHELEALFGCSRRLAVYGSLAPGRENHHVVAPLGGTWSEGIVEGELARHGWGAAMGYPALRVRPGGPAVRVRVLTSQALAAAWHELDAFEGPEYRRVLVAVLSPDPDAERALLTVANLYEAGG